MNSSTNGNYLEKECKRKKREQDTKISLSLLSNVTAYQEGVFYDYNQGMYLDRPGGKPIRDMHSQPINP